MNLPKNKPLVIFDFDETLCKTNGLIKRTKTGPDGQSSEDFLTPGEYSAWRETGEYNLNPNSWHLDFKSFTGYPNEGTPIQETFELLVSYLEYSTYTVALVTGRDELSGPYSFLVDHKINVDKMIFMCSGDPNKRMCYESLINTLQPSSVLIYEDATAYIDQCNEVCEKYNIPFDSQLIGDGKIRWDWKTIRKN